MSNTGLLSNLTILLLYSLSLQCLAQQSLQARILVYSATREYRHDSIPTAIAALQALGPAANILFDNTEDQTRFTDAILSGYDAILFLDTTGEVLDDPGIAAFQWYLNSGGNFIGIHAASDCLVNTSFYGMEVGAYFDYHPDLQNALFTKVPFLQTVDVIGPPHPSTSMLPAQWHVQDEMYNFKSDPRAIGAIVILSANESSYTDPGPRNYDQGSPHPTAWYQEHGAGSSDSATSGRSFYTSLGHLNETWQDDLFMAHVMGGIVWTLQSNTTRAFNASATVGNPGTSGSSNIQTSSPTSHPSRATPVSVPSFLGLLTASVVCVSIPFLLRPGLLP